MGRIFAESDNYLITTYKNSAHVIVNLFNQLGIIHEKDYQ